MERIMEKKKKKKDKYAFKKFLVIYMFILTILMIFSLIYVINSLKTYESLQVNNFLDKTMEKVKKAGEKSKISEYVDLSSLKLSKFEKESDSKDKLVAGLIKDSKFTYKLNSESIDLTNPIYDVYAGDEVLFNVKLNGEKKVTRLGILTFQDWKLDSIKLAKTDGIYECNIQVPSNLKVYVNGIKLTDEDKSDGEQDEGLKEISTYVDIPYLISYKITGLIKEPEVKIEDESGKSVECDKEGSTYIAGLKREKIENKDEAMKKIKGDVDIERIAKDWSLYLTDDLDGKLHGFYNISTYMIKDSYMYKYAYKWATNVDITFVSSHILDNPTFTDVELKNFIIYSEDAFSCEIYLQKNLTLSKDRSKKIKDKMHERMYFAYYEGEWKLVNMQSITNNDN